MVCEIMLHSGVSGSLKMWWLLLAWWGNYPRSVLVFFSSRRRHTRLVSDWSSDVCSSDLGGTLSLDKVDGVVVPARVISKERKAIVFHESRHEIGRASCRERV